MADKRAKLIERGRALERKRRIAEAIEVYQTAGAVQDAARLLAGEGRYGDAGKIVLSRIGMTPAQLRRATPEQRKLVLVAASYFSKDNQTTQAVELLLSIGEKSRAAELLERAGDLTGAERIRQGDTGVVSAPAGTGPKRDIHDKSDPLNIARKLEQEGKIDSAIAAYVKARRYEEVGRLEWQRGNLAQAANYYKEAGHIYAATEAFIAARNPRAAFDTVVKATRHVPDYRRACVRAIELAVHFNELNFAFENMLTHFVPGGPQSADEQAAFLALARLYARHDFSENAVEAYKQLLLKGPGHTEAQAELAQLNQADAVAHRMRAGHIVREQAAFRGEDLRGRREPASAVGPLPGLPDLPDLPSLPAKPPAAPPPQQPPQQMVPQANAPQAVAPKQPPAGGPVPQGGTLAAWQLQSPPSPVSAVNAAAANQHQPATPSSPSGNIAADPTQHFATAPDASPSGTPADQQPMPPPTSILDVGAVVATRYRLNQKIGEGGMAAVFRATDLELGEEIALKVFNSPLQNDEMVARFRQELKLTRRLSHPNIIRLFDIGVYHGFRYISMELLKGQSLEQRLEQPIELTAGIDYLVQACAGLSAAHEQGVIHRDVKPDNFFITKENVLKVMDFGIAKHQEGPTFTVMGRIAGTPAYMSPEQINNFSAVTAAADIYALGIIAYRMFTGALPFDHPDFMGLLMKHINEEPVPPRQINPNIPEPLEQLILHMLRKKPEERHATCADLAAALTEVLSQ